MCWERVGNGRCKLFFWLSCVIECSRFTQMGKKHLPEAEEKSGTFGTKFSANPHTCAKFEEGGPIKPE